MDENAKWAGSIPQGMESDLNISPEFSWVMSLPPGELWECNKKKKEMKICSGSLPQLFHNFTCLKSRLFSAIIDSVSWMHSWRKIWCVEFPSWVITWKTITKMEGLKSHFWQEVRVDFWRLAQQHCISTVPWHYTVDRFIFILQLCSFSGHPGGFF